MRHYFTRHQAATPARLWLAAAFGSFVAIAAAGLLSTYAHAPVLMAPFGASAVLLFSMPDSPLSQPINVIGGYAVTTLLALALQLVLPDGWWTVALSVAAAVGVMAALRLTHPPAGAVPLIVFGTHPDFSFLLTPVLAGSAILVATAIAFHRMAGRRYPRPA